VREGEPLAATFRPPLDRWEEWGAITELTRLAAELPDVGADKAWERLERLTEAQRAAIEEVLRRVERWRG
jgi:hypothetical protein